MNEEDKLGILAGVTFVLSPDQYTEYKKSLNEQINDLQKQLNKQKKVLDKIKDKCLENMYIDDRGEEVESIERNIKPSEILELLEEIK